MKYQSKTQQESEKAIPVSFLKEKTESADDQQHKMQMKSSISSQKRINPRLLADAVFGVDLAVSK